MKNGYSRVWLTFIFFGFVFGIDAQTTTVVETVPQRTVFEFADQPEAQMKITVAGPSMGPTSVRLDVESTGERPITGYVLLIDLDGDRRSSIIIRPEKPLVEGRPEPQGLGISTSGRKAADKVSIVIDFVLFADGTSWGADSRGGSKAIKAYLTGRDLAMKRLVDMIAEAGLNRENILAHFKSFGSSGFGSDMTTKLDIARFGRDGYSGVIRTLRAPGKPETQELARKLELQENSLEQ